MRGDCGYAANCGANAIAAVAEWGDFRRSRNANTRGRFPVRRTHATLAECGRMRYTVGIATVAVADSRCSNGEDRRRVGC